MRTIDVLVASALLGVALGTLFDEPGAAASGNKGATAAQATGSCDRSLCESLTWLRTPVMRRASPGK